MPEGPELHLASRFINSVCKGRVFSGNIVKSDVHKSQEVAWQHGDYSISACSRGKELKLTLTAATNLSNDEQKKKDNGLKSKMPASTDIMIQFGMTGRFHFCEVANMEKHSHLNFYTKVEDSSPAEVLSFVDYRRFGRWTQGADWSKDRGPCIMFEYQAFRKNVLDSLENSAFNKPICEALLNQKFFNGIGNYLRAEILFRAGIKPFECARSVLQKLQDSPAGDMKKIVVKSENPDILALCHLLAQEVIQLGVTGYDPYNKDSFAKFTDWLQCYYNPKMTNMADHNRRTIWFAGDPGPMVPKEQKTKRIAKSSKIVKRKSKQMVEAGEELPEILQSPAKKPRRNAGNRRVTRKALAEEVLETPSPMKKTSKRNSAKPSKGRNTSGRGAKSKSPTFSKTASSKHGRSTQRGRRKAAEEKKAEINGRGDSDVVNGKQKVISSLRRTTRTSSSDSRSSGEDASVHTAKSEQHPSVVAAIRRSTRTSSSDSRSSGGSRRDASVNIGRSARRNRKT